MALGAKMFKALLYRKRFKNLNGPLKKWNTDVFGNIFKEAQRLEDTITELQDNDEVGVLNKKQ